ncbi:hypothetical protein VTH06DRAFT_2424 [Thermothelomyces fergusii]
MTREHELSTPRRRALKVLLNCQLTTLVETFCQVHSLRLPWQKLCTFFTRRTLPALKHKSSDRMTDTPLKG